MDTQRSAEVVDSVRRRRCPVFYANRDQLSVMLCLCTSP